MAVFETSAQLVVDEKTAPVSQNTIAPLPESSPNTPTPTPTPETTPCACKKITTVCLSREDLDRKCGVGSAACALADLCIMYVVKGSSVCAQLTQDPISQVQPAQVVNRLARGSKSPTGNDVKGSALISFVDEALLEAMIAVSEAPTLEVIDEKCLLEHEYVHLCTGGDPYNRCAFETPATAVHTKCYLDAITKYCSPSQQDSSPNPELCKQLCHRHTGYTARSNFPPCFCNWRDRNGGVSDGHRACCDCYGECRATQVHPLCRPFDEHARTALESVCTSLLNPALSHSCGFFGSWTPPWNTRIVDCSRVSPR